MDGHHHSSACPNSHGSFTGQPSQMPTPPPSASAWKEECVERSGASNVGISNSPSAPWPGTAISNAQVPANGAPGFNPSLSWNTNLPPTELFPFNPIRMSHGDESIDPRSLASDQSLLDILSATQPGHRSFTHPRDVNLDYYDPTSGNSTHQPIVHPPVEYEGFLSQSAPASFTTPPATAPLESQYNVTSNDSQELNYAQWIHSQRSMSQYYPNDAQALSQTNRYDEFPQQFNSREMMDGQFVGNFGQNMVNPQDNSEEVNMQGPMHFMQYTPIEPTTEYLHHGNPNTSSPPQGINAPSDCTTIAPASVIKSQSVSGRRRVSKQGRIVPTSLRTGDNITIQHYEFTPSPVFPFTQSRESEAGPSTSASRDRAAPYIQGRVDLDPKKKGKGKSPGRLILHSPEDDRQHNAQRYTMNALSSAVSSSSSSPPRTLNDQGTRVISPATKAKRISSLQRAQAVPPQTIVCPLRGCGQTISNTARDILLHVESCPSAEIRAVFESKRQRNMNAQDYMTPAQFLCPTCPGRRKFTSPAGWSDHLVKMHGEWGPHPCTECEEKFLSAKDLERHKVLEH